MNLKDYLTALPRSEWEGFAKRAGTTVAYLWQLKGGHSFPSAKKWSVYIKASNGLVTLADLHRELVAREAA